MAAARRRTTTSPPRNTASREYRHYTNCHIGGLVTILEISHVLAVFIFFYPSCTTHNEVAADWYIYISRKCSVGCIKKVVFIKVHIS